MRYKLSMNEAADILVSSFSPLDAHVRAADGNSRLVLTVFGENPVVIAQEFTRVQVTDARRLESIIWQLREQLDPNGEILHPWSFPTDQ